MIDTAHGVAVDVEATRSIWQAEVGATKTMLMHAFFVVLGYVAAQVGDSLALSLWPGIPIKVVLKRATRTVRPKNQRPMQHWPRCLRDARRLHLTSDQSRLGIR